MADDVTEESGNYGGSAGPWARTRSSNTSGSEGEPASKDGGATLGPRPGPKGFDWARLAWRMPLYFAGTGVLAGAWFLALPVALASRGARRRLRRYTMRGWGRWSLWCFAIELETRGTLPREGVLLVANHTSYVDIWVLAARLDPVFVSMEELARWPFFGFMARALGTVFLDRRRKRDILAANRAMLAWIEQGYTVVLFPEGGNSHGHAVQRFRPSLLEPAAAERVPVACATLGYATEPEDPPASRVVAWVRDPFLPHALMLASRRRIRARLVLHTELEQHDDRKELAGRLHARVASVFRTESGDFLPDSERGGPDDGQVPRAPNRGENHLTP
ncbi:MAG: 1-acyl-sn-glycerol-3-phosphate acyltransferase [Planctomycetes bacterium]|nr:1-acyl-sn-glycerol-3-phosphate acyltransferase [Planctomycetota bacterium]